MLKTEADPEHCDELRSSRWRTNGDVGDPMSDNKIFSGIKVVDLASFIAGPAAATILSDFGADVIKVEPPGFGDLQRALSSVPPSPRAEANYARHRRGAEATYAGHLTTRNKRGMAIDLKSPRGGEILERLVRWADVLITNFP